MTGNEIKENIENPGLFGFPLIFCFDDVKTSCSPRCRQNSRKRDL